MDRLTCMSVFEATVRSGSIAGAARLLNLAPSRASKYLAALEADLGVLLLRRSTRRLTLTSQGEAYLQRCRSILAQMQEADDEARSKKSAISGLLRVTAPVTFGALHMGSLVADFLSRHPKVTLDLVLDDRYHDLQTGTADVALRIGRLADSPLVGRRLGACRMVLCASPAFLQATPAIAHPADLTGLPLLAFSEPVSTPDWTLKDALGHPHRVEGHSRVTANNMQMLTAAAMAGVGIVFGPSFVLGPCIARGELVRVLPDYEAMPLDITVVYATRTFLPGAVRAFVDFLAHELTEPFSWDVSI